jgi:hypothetical protein
VLTSAGRAAAPAEPARGSAQPERPDSWRGRPDDKPDPRDAVAVLADVLARDDAQHAALDVLARELGGADHLARLDTMWQAETAGPAGRVAGHDPRRAAARLPRGPAGRRDGGPGCGGR